MPITFNKPYLAGKELEYIADAVNFGYTAGNGGYTKKCHQFFETRYQFNKVLLTTSCTDALEMTALLANIQVGDEVIMPSFTFVSTANAFVLRGAKIRFADSGADNPNICIESILPLITEKTKAIVVVHYAGIACDMDPILELANQHNLIVIEDAAQAIDSFYKGRPLGGIGHFGTFSFHETKNIACGEGGMLCINDPNFKNRAEIIWEKGTNRAAFYRGEVEKYVWVDLGSSFLPPEITAAFLYAQLEEIEKIQQQRIAIWHRYNEGLQALKNAGRIALPEVPEYASINGHLFYLVCASEAERTALVDHLKADGIHAVFHYISLHSSTYFSDKHDGRALPNSDRFTGSLLRLPLFYELSEGQQTSIIDSIFRFYS